jgi:hypothetical protein
MAEPRDVACVGTGKVEPHDIEFPTFELKDGPGVNPATSGAGSRTLPSSGSSRRTSVAPTST